MCTRHEHAKHGGVKRTALNGDRPPVRIAPRGVGRKDPREQSTLHHANNQPGECDGHCPSANVGRCEVGRPRDTDLRRDLFQDISLLSRPPLTNGAEGATTHGDHSYEKSQTLKHLD